MFSKTFVSLYFLKDSILVVELDSHRKKVIKHSSVKLPQGIINNYKISDIKGLSELIKSFWQKYRFKEKTVAIVVPEFSTFTKPLSFPKLPVAELKEAISWQAQEYLPEAPENMIIDWKIIEKSEKGIEVLVVAIPKELLMGYVKACELAGLFPSAVQIPSVCLTNLIKESDGDSLILYLGTDEAVLVYSNKEKILGSSVLSQVSEKEVVQTAIRMVNHFGKNRFKNLYISGPMISEAIASELNGEFKIPVSVLKPEITGLDEKSIQEILIPISLQMGALTEPSDPLTLNLLPNYLVEKYKAEKAKIQVWSLTLTITLFVWVSFILVLGSYLVMMEQVLSLKARNENSIQISQARKKYQEDAKKINDTSAKILKIKNVSVSPEVVLNEIWSQKPQGIQITKYKMDFQKGNMVLNGVSVDRVSLINFEKNLETIPTISQVSIPIASFEKESNLEFQLSFQYLTKKPATVGSEKNLQK